MPEILRNDIVRHCDLGIGQVSEVGDTDITVEFRGEVGRRPVKRDELDVLPAEGFWHQAYHTPELVRRLLKEGPAQVVLLVLRDMPHGEARMDQIGDQITAFDPGIDWPAWWKHTQKLLRVEPQVDTSRAREKVYAVAQTPRTHLEELVDEYTRLPSRVITRAGESDINTEKVDRACQILREVARHQALAPDVRDELQRFAERVVLHPGLPVPDRVDLLLRLIEVDWLPPEKARSYLSRLCQPPIRLYELDRYAANRVVDAILEHVGAEDGQASLLTAFAADAELIEQVAGLYRARHLPDAALQGLYYGCSEVLPDAGAIQAGKEGKSKAFESWYAALAKRLSGLGELLYALILDGGVAVDWARLAGCLAHLLEYADCLDGQIPLTDELLQSLVGLWRRAIIFAPAGQQARFLDLLLGAPMRPRLTSAFLTAIFKPRPPDAMADEFVGRMAQHTGDLDPWLSCIVENHWTWASATEAMEYLITRLGGRSDVRDWTTDRVLRSMQSGASISREVLLLLDHLVQAGASPDRLRSWREQAFGQVCAEIATRTAAVDRPLMFDAAAASGLRGFLDGLSQDHRRQMEDLEKQAGQLALDLQHTQTELAELRQGYGRQSRSAEFSARRPVLEAYAAAAAEFERFAARQAPRQSELTGVVRRLNRLLADFGVTPGPAIGEEVDFDTARHQLTGGTGEPVRRVRIVERGYSIPGPDGQAIPLRPAKVVPAGG